VFDHLNIDISRYNLTVSEASTLIVLPNLSNIHYVTYVLDYVYQCSKQKAKVLILDLSDLESGGQESFPRLPKLLNLHHQIRRELKYASADFDVEWFIPSSVPSLPVDLILAVKELKSLDELLTWNNFSGDLGRSVYSIIVTDIAKGFFIGRRKLMRVASSLVADFYSAYFFTEYLLKENKNIDQVVILNGRAPIQAGGSVAAKEETKRICYMEHGGTPGLRYRMERWVSQNRLCEQEDILERESVLGSFDLSAAKEWFSDQVSETGSNRFAQGFQRDTILDQQAGRTKTVFQRPLATIFTSSIDEFAGSDEDAWPSSPWQSQEEAIIWLVTELNRKGYDVVIRIHPNLCNKSWQEINRVSKSFSKLDARIISPSNSESSYRLMKDSDVCFVWASTIGLEASAYGKPTHIMYHSLYDMVADIRKIETREHLDGELIWSVDPSRALVYQTLAMQRGQKVDFCLPQNTQSRFEHLFKIMNQRKRIMRGVFTPVLVLKEPNHSLKILRRVFGSRVGGVLWEKLFWSINE